MQVYGVDANIQGLNGTFMAFDPLLQRFIYLIDEAADRLNANSVCCLILVVVIFTSVFI